MLKKRNERTYEKVGPYLLLHFILFLYSISGICSKIASQKPFFSFEFCFFYGSSLLILAIYAVLWQQLLKKLPLNIAYANKAICLIWGMLWGAVIFMEQISANSIIGAIFVIVGIILMIGLEKDE